MSKQSKHFGARQLGGLEKVGDAMLPGRAGRDEMPSFSQIGCVRFVDRVLDHMPARDLSDLKLLLGLLSFFPSFLVSWFIKALELSKPIPGPLGSLLRFMRLGLRGLVMTLYYTDPKALQIIDYEAKVYTDDFTAAH